MRRNGNKNYRTIRVSTSEIGRDAEVFVMKSERTLVQRESEGFHLKSGSASSFDIYCEVF